MTNARLSDFTSLFIQSDDGELKDGGEVIRDNENGAVEDEEDGNDDLSEIEANFK